jgi:TolA protein
MNWNSDTGKAFKMSLALHAAVFVVVFVGTFVSSIFNKPEVPPHVFQLQGIKGPPHIGAPGRLAGDRKAPRTDKPSVASAAPGTNDLNLPKLDNRPIPTEDEGDDSEPAPAPAKPTPAPTPKAASKAVAKASSKSSKNAATSKNVRPAGNKAVATSKASAKNAKPQTMSYSDFAKQHKIGSSKGTGGTGTGKKAGKKGGKGGASRGVPGGMGIDASGIISDMKSNLSWGDGGDGGGGLAGGTGVTSGDSDALGDYFQRVRALIDSYFNEPKGVMKQVSALVQFTIMANGTVTGVNLVKSSGNDAFDSAAVSAVKSLGRLDPPPGNMAYTRKIEFVGKRGD